MRQPIEAMLDAVDWQAVEIPPDGGDSSVPHATHEGFLSIAGDFGVRCYQLSDGRRILDGNDMNELFGG